MPSAGTGLQDRAQLVEVHALDRADAAAVLVGQAVHARADAERDVEHLGDLGALEPPADVRGGELAEPDQRVARRRLGPHVVDERHQHGLHLQVLLVGPLGQQQRGVHQRSPPLAGAGPGVRVRPFLRCGASWPRAC